MTDDGGQAQLGLGCAQIGCCVPFQFACDVQDENPATDYVACDWPEEGDRGKDDRSGCLFMSRVADLCLQQQPAVIILRNAQLIRVIIISILISAFLLRGV